MDDGWTDGRINGGMDGWTDRQMDRWTGGWVSEGKVNRSFIHSFIHVLKNLSTIQERESLNLGTRMIDYFGTKMGDPGFPQLS